jgi:hypothetical protein
MDQAKWMAFEARAMGKICALERFLRRTSDGNTGFDLFEAD